MQYWDDERSDFDLLDWQRIMLKKPERTWRMEYEGIFVGDEKSQEKPKGVLLELYCLHCTHVLEKVGPSTGDVRLNLNSALEKHWECPQCKHSSWGVRACMAEVSSEEKRT